MGPYKTWIDEGGVNEATEDMIIILPDFFSSISGIKALHKAITDVPKTLINFSSTSIDVLWNWDSIP